MCKVLFFRIANQQISDIFDYGYDNFVLDRAHNYIKGLYKTLNDTAKTRKYNNSKWQKVPQEYICDLTDEQLYFIRYKRHVIFFRTINKNDIGVVAILGDRQDIPQRIRDFL